MATMHLPVLPQRPAHFECRCVGGAGRSARASILQRNHAHCRLKPKHVQRRGQLQVTHESSSTERITEELRNSEELLIRTASSDAAAPSGNGALPVAPNGASLNGTSPNGAALNGAVRNGSSLNGASSSNSTASVIIAPGIKTEVDYSHGGGPSAATAPPVLTAEEVDGYADACEVGQLEACAAQRLTDSMDAGPGPSSEAAAAAAAAKTTASSGARSTPFTSPGGRWTQFQKYSTFQRTWQIWTFALAFAVRYVALSWKITYGRGGMTPERVIDRRQKLASWLREGLIKLGPTFIKIGQQFSTRVDVLSKEFVAELEMLQDNVPSFSSAQAIEIVERNLGAPIAEKFESFDPVPIAAASLGQVHLAKLRGEMVVVKVQRPGLKKLFDIDLKNIRVLAQWLQKLDPQSDGAARDWVAIYDECSRILYQEIDYRLEGENADRFRKNFADKDWVLVPKIDWEYTTSEILTMEYCPGIKINRADQLDAKGIDRKRLAKLSVECYLEQLLTYGFFHADPHPGNIAVDAVGGGRLIYYDFGMMGVIPSDIRAGLLELFYGVYQKDPDKCIAALIQMGVLIPGNDLTAVRRTARFFLANFEERLKAQKEEAASNPDYDSEFKGKASKAEKQQKRKAILSAIGEDLLVASADKPFRFPATFTFVVRSFTVLDGIGKSLNPRFDISEIAAPYARGLLLEGSPQYAKLRSEFGKGLKRQNRAVKNLFVAPNMIEDVALTMRSLENGDIKLRVRALEAERALSRVQDQQKVVTKAILASTLVNVGTVLSSSTARTTAVQWGSKLSWAGAAVLGLMTIVSILKIKKAEKKELAITGAA